MQYVLTEAEYAALKKAAENVKLAATKKLQAFCTRVADELPVDWGWTKGDPPKPWGCIITEAKKAEAVGGHPEWYCDQCPAQELCPFEHKRWSK